MKTFFKKIYFCLLAAAPVVCHPAAGEPAKSPDSGTTTPLRSVFIMPANAKEGRDPFYPESTRPYENAVKVSHTVEVTSLVVNGYSIENGHPMVIINNQPFMIGDEGDVKAAGGRIHVLCVDIRDGVATIEANGQRHELRF